MHLSEARGSISSCADCGECKEHLKLLHVAGVHITLCSDCLGKLASLTRTYRWKVEKG